MISSTNQIVNGSFLGKHDFFHQEKMKRFYPLVKCSKIGCVICKPLITLVESDSESDYIKGSDSE
jgi:hypothetical protein